MDLEKFVSGQSNVGEHDSTGVFTLSLEQASRKLSHYRFPRQHAWVCLLVQAAVGWRCRNFVVTQTAHETSFRLAPASAKLPRSKETLSALDTELDGKSSLSRFCLALQFLLNNQPDLPISLLEDKNENLLLTLSHEKPKKFGWLPLSARKHQLGAVEELDDFAVYSPVPIIVDGRRIISHPKNLMCILGRSPRPDLPVLLLPDYLKKLGDVSAFMEIRCSDDIQRQPARRCALRWMQHGVVVEEQRLELETRALEASFVLNGEDLQTDLTGFRLVEDPDKKNRLVSSLLDLIPALRKARKSLKIRGREEEEAAYRQPGLAEQGGEGYFVILPAPLLATGGLLILLSPLVVFTSGLGLAAVSMAAAGAGFMKAGMWSTADNIKKRRLAPQEKTQATYGLLLEELSQLEKLLQALVNPGKV